MLSRIIIGVAAVVVAVSTLTGCSIEKFCSPPDLTVSPKQVYPGGTAVLNADAAKCDLKQESEYRITLETPGGASFLLGSTVPKQNGKFSFRFTIPKSLSPGRYTVNIEGSVLGKGGAEGGNWASSGAAYVTTVQIVTSPEKTD